MNGSMDPGATFSMYENSKGKLSFQEFPYSAIIQDLGHDIHVCHTLAWTVYDIHETIHHHI